MCPIFVAVVFFVFFCLAVKSLFIVLLKDDKIVML